MSGKLVFSNSVLKASINRLKVSPPIYDSFLKQGNFSREFVEDEKQWHNMEFASQYWRLFAATFGEDALESSTMELYEELHLRAFTAIIGLLFSAESFFEKIPIWSNRVNHFNIYMFRVVERGLGTTTGELVQDYLSTHDKALCSHMCLCSRGSIKGSLKAMGYKLISLKEVECINTGATRCVYHFTWKNRYELAPILASTFAAGLTGMAVNLFAETSLAMSALFALAVWFAFVFGYRYFAMKSRLSEAVAFQDSAFKDYQELLYKHEALNEKLFEYQNELQNTLKLAQLGELSYGLLHDMATPIQSIGISSDKMENYINHNRVKSAELNSSIAAIVQATKKLTQFQKNLRKLVGGRQDKTAVVVTPKDVILEVTELLSFMQTREKINVTVNVDPDLRYVQVYESYLERILLNLLTNSYKYLHETRDKIVMISAYRSDDFYTIEIKDNGAGIPQDALRQLTKVFGYSRDSDVVAIKGSGFGVYAVSRMVRSMKGEIQIDSKEGVGTVVKIILPVKLESLNPNKDSAGQS